MASHFRALPLIFLISIGCGGGDDSSGGSGGASTGGAAGTASGGTSGTGAGGASGNGSGGQGGSAGITGVGGAASCGETCSGHGSCVTIDQQSTCACDSGYYPALLECLADPCENGGGTCYYVDSASGLDSNDGSLAKPWKTTSKVNQAAASFQAGDYVLFHRGGDWSADSTLTISGVKGTEAAPVTYGAYGPIGDARPKVGAVRIDKQSSNVTLRDVESAGSTGGPCVAMESADHVIVQNIVAHDCQSNGIHFGGQTSYGTMIDNLVYKVNANDALVIHSPVTLTLATAVGDHFWIVNNRVPGEVGEQPVDIATGSDTVPGSRDMKIVGNVLGNGSNGCVSLGHGNSVAWVVGNILGNCTATETSSGVGLGGTHKENSGKSYRVYGNLIFWNLMPHVETFRGSAHHPANVDREQHSHQWNWKALGDPGELQPD